ncbi:Toxin-antitoxin system, antitoxin component, Phd-like [Desulfonema limicola]|uniref:Antitoxin n=1 Tax=Desulfonema limicola TaxID=45656 RepID=A0A975B5M5_9BACT|nr:type II toxin-antitoxin system prevent-host-death family antitoxin [Desulfonema limicola]QTA79219.1 Toxin-antitoxin system, antitoxin component, Phd-like [Desulfonema limicola]
MKNEIMAVAEAKKRFSEIISKSAYSDQRIIITKRNRPIAAVISIEDLHSLEQIEKRKGLMEIIGKWQNFDEINDAIDNIVDKRHKEGTGRNVSF